MKNIDVGIMAFTNYNDIEKSSNKSIYVFNCGYFITHKKITYLTESENASAYLLVYLHKGSMQVLLNDKYESYSEGHVLIFHPRQKRYIVYDDNAENERYFVYFQGSEVERFLKQLSLFDKTVYKTGDIYPVIDDIKAIIEDFKTNDFVHDLNRLTYLFSILKKVGDSILPVDIDKKYVNSEINKVIKIMETSYYKNFDLKYYAGVCNESVPSFIRHFKRQTGVSPMKYINNLKINIAKSFLSNTNLSVSEISFNVGIQNPLYLCNFFKKNVGISPTLYREQNNGFINL